MYLLDRMLIRNYVKSYLFCLMSLLTLYVVVDLFNNLDDFSKHHMGMGQLLQRIGFYYGFQVWQIFDRLCEAIVLLAATFTIAWVQRNNELLPLLSAGVSTRRVVLPILVSAWMMLTLAVVNQEFIIPRISMYLMYDKDDPKGESPVMVQGAFEPNGIHIDGSSAFRKGMLVKEFSVLFPENIFGTLFNLTAKEAYYIPLKSGDSRSGGWLLTETQPAEPPENANFPDLRMIDAGKFFLRTRGVDFDTVTRGRNWFRYASTNRLRLELARPDSTRLAAMAVLFHQRLTRPILGMILVLMGLSIILRDQNCNVFISAGLCLVLCGVFFAAQFACKSLGDNEYLSPALAAWLPVLLFGPLSFTMFDAIHT